MRGHIRKRSKNSYTIVLDVGKDPATGRRKQQWLSVRGTKKDAERKLAELANQLDTGGFVKPTRLTIADFLSQWLRDYAQTSVRARTFLRYQQIVERHLIPHMGRIPLTELRPQHIQAMYAQSLAARLDGKPGGLSPRTLLQHHRVLSEALSHAVQWGLASRNVAKAVDAPRYDRTEIATMDADDVHRLLSEAHGTMYYSLIHLAVFTGLRRGELLGLRWKDVDLDLADLSVSQVLHRLPGKRTVFAEPKTQKARRVVALSPTAILTLRAHRERQEADRESVGRIPAADDLVFSQPDGSPILPDTVTHAFYRIAEKAGLKGFTFHDLRHTHASLMLSQGIHPKVVQERLGHATISTTLDIYSHVAPHIQTQAALQFEEALSGVPKHSVGVG
jgi:integrase